MRHWDTEKSWSLSFRERVAKRRENEAHRYGPFGFHAGEPRKLLERRSPYTGDWE